MSDLTPQFPEALTWPERAKALAVKTPEQYAVAASMKIDLASLRKKIVEEFAPMKEAAHKAHKAITSKEGEYLKPLVEAEGILITALKTFEQEQERIRLEAERLAREEAIKREEEERLAAALEAPAEEQEAILAAPAYVAPVVVAPTYQKVTGTGVRYTWSARVVDIKKLCKAIADGLVPETFVLPNQPVLNARAKADQTMMKVPGVEAVRQ